MASHEETRVEAHETLPRMVYRFAHERPDEAALVSIGQGEATWAELWRDTRHWAGWLRQQGVRAGDRVVALMPQSLEAAHLWLGCCVLGAVDVSVNTQFRGEWLRHALVTSLAKVLVIPQRYLEQVLAVLPQTRIATVCIIDVERVDVELPPGVRLVTGSPLAAAPEADREPASHPHDTACILYTSGTTGASKAVQITWGLIHHTAQTYRRFLRPRDGHVFYFPYSAYHLAGRMALHVAGLGRGRAVIREQFSTSAFWDDVRAHRCTWSLLFGAPARFLANRPESTDDRDHSLELVLVNPLLPEIDLLKRRYGFEAFTTYGMTETGITLNAEPAETISAHAGSCGRPVPGFEVRLVDENDYPVAPGEPGELVVRSSDPWLVTPGYQAAPEATAKAWRNGWFHSGDMFRQDADGRFHFVDRAKDMIRRRGENISSAELESAVLSHDCVAEAAAVGVPSEFSDEEVLVVAVAKAGHSIDPDQLSRWLEERVPRFVNPRFIRVAPALPRTPETARVQRHKLREEGITAGTWDRQAARLNQERRNA